MKFIWLFIILLISFYSRAQDESIHQDSIECFLIPLELKTIYNIDKNEIVSGDRFKDIVVIKSKITEAEQLKYFSMINLSDSNEVFRSESVLSANDVDARVVMLLYSKSNIDTLVIDPKGFYFYDGELYNPNVKLMLWLNEYGTDAMQYQLFKDSLSNELKIKYNFLVNTVN